MPPPAPATPALTLTAEEREPLSIAVARRLRDAIVSGQVAEGAELPSEKELGQQLGVGRSTIREAIRVLQAQGLVSGGDTVSTARPRVSARRSLASASQTMVNALRLGQVALAELVALRVVIEGAIVEAAAAQAAPDLAVARAAVATMATPGLDVAAFRAADLAFHSGLAMAAGNAAFGLVMTVMRDAISAHLGEALERVPQPARAMAALAREHAAILEAVERGHGKRARALITAHVEDFYRTAAR